METHWYERAQMDFREGGMVYLVKFPDGTTDYVDENKYKEIRNKVELLDKLPAKFAPMRSDHLERFDRYLH